MNETGVKVPGAVRKAFGWLALLTSTGTLLCCALPAAIAAVAGGASVVAFVSLFPWLIPLSRNKGWIFLAAGVLLLISGVLTFRPRGRIACALTGGTACEAAGRFGKVLFWVSAAVYGTGAFFAYGLVPILRWIGG